MNGILHENNSLNVARQFNGLGLVHFLTALCRSRGINQSGRKGKHKMIMTLTVFKEVHNTWPPKNGKPGGEAYDLLCMDMSNPAEHRMEEMLYYRTKDEERPRVWGKSVGTTIQVGVAKIRHGDNGGKATLLGSIIAEAKK
jgi:hypothetical protein